MLESLSREHTTSKTFIFSGADAAVRRGCGAEGYAQQAPSAPSPAFGSVRHQRMDLADGTGDDHIVAVRREVAFGIAVDDVFVVLEEVAEIPGAQHDDSD